LYSPSLANVSCFTFLCLSLAIFASIPTGNVSALSATPTAKAQPVDAGLDHCQEETQSQCNSNDESSSESLSQEQDPVLDSDCGCGKLNRNNVVSKSISGSIDQADDINNNPTSHGNSLNDDHERHSDLYTKSCEKNKCRSDKTTSTSESSEKQINDHRSENQNSKFKDIKTLNEENKADIDEFVQIDDDEQNIEELYSHAEDFKAVEQSKYRNKQIVDRKSLFLSNPMVEILGGSFLMGTEQVFIAQDGESPIREVKISTFYLDKHEVSNQEFSAFVDATNYKTEVSFKS